MKTTVYFRRCLAVWAAVNATGAAAFGQIVFSDNFESDSANRYTIVADPDSLAIFAYDYSLMGIPAAPNSTGGSTLGLRLEANNGDATGAAAAINLSPLGLSLTGDYVLRFDMWLNANGPFPDGGTGSTQFLTAGVGTTGGTLHKAGSGDGTWFAVDNEGNSGIDYRLYFNGSLQASDSGYYSAGTAADSRNAFNGYYASHFPGQEPPRLQQDTFFQQTGALKNGAVGFAWRQVEITRSGADVAWSIDGLEIARITNPPLTDTNVFIGYWDPFASISDNPPLTFGVIDNFRVEVVPEPAVALSLIGAAGLLALRRRRA